MTVSTKTVRPQVEMSKDVRFERRLRRLVGVSLVFLGVIAFLAWAKADADARTLALLVSGWILMPTLLFVSISKPLWRYLLAVPAVLMIVGLLRTTLDADTAVFGWWLITAGIAIGGTLGTWFWYRWLPVPSHLDDPFSPGRWALVAIHVGLVLAGIVLVLAQ
jgi:hypothetical protein